MIILYQPEGGDERQFDVRSVRTSEAQIVERTTDMKWSDIKIGIRDDDPIAMRGVAWVLLKREQPSLRWSEFDPLIDELRVRFDDREVRTYVGNILRLPEGDRAQPMAELRFYALDQASVDVALKEASEPPKEAETEASPDDA
ncbi:hypothetical protein ACWGVR_14440 [Streptomyces xanthophaeus]